MRDPKFLPQFSDSESGTNFTQGRKKPQTNNSTYYDPTDLYKTNGLAADRAFNIGCTGTRKVIVDSGGGFKFAPCATAQTYISVMASMPTDNRDRRYFSFDPTENLYDIRDSFNDNAYSGFNYKNQIFKRTLSNVILKDPVKESILVYFQKVVFGLIETTKQIKNFVNYTVKKNNKRVF
jgi:hypothetical protein